MSVDWNFLFGSLALERSSRIDGFYELLSAGFRTHVPINEVKFSVICHRFNRSILKLRIQKSKKFSNYRRKSPEVAIQFIRTLARAFSLHSNWHAIHIFTELSQILSATIKKSGITQIQSVLRIHTCK